MVGFEEQVFLVESQMQHNSKGVLVVKQLVNAASTAPRSTLGQKIVMVPDNQVTIALPMSPQ